uniref:Uncharacterized protein n=1 Tax=Anguilla anguilla TaxID=7936 RepID=A0A0E9SK93_ANGAN
MPLFVFVQPTRLLYRIQINRSGLGVNWKLVKFNL